MKNIFALLFVAFLSINSHAEDHGRFGINAGLGLPFLIQAGLNFYVTENFGIDLSYGQLDITSGQAKARLSMPYVLAKWHPLGGAWYIGGGLGRENMTATAEDSGQKAEIKVEANTGVAQIGWMWGSGNGGGLWFGLDVSYIVPFGASQKITSTLPVTDQDYIDAKDAADKFGETSYMNFTFAKIGYLF